VLTIPASSDSTPNAPSSEDSSSFADVMHQHDGGSSSTPGAPAKETNSKPATNSPTAATTPIGSTGASDSSLAIAAAPTPVPVPAKGVLVTATPTGTTAPKGKTTLSPGSDLSAMMIQAALLASNAKQTGAAVPAAPMEPTTGKDTVTNEEDAPSTSPQTGLANLLAQALALTSSVKPTVTTTTTSSDKTTTSDGTSNSEPDDDSDKSASAAATSITTDLSALIAQATLLAAVVQQNAAATSSACTTSTVATQGKEIPLPIATKAVAGNSTKEKKSAVAEAEGNFLQSDASASPSSSTVVSLAAAVAGRNIQASHNQQNGISTGSKNPSTDAISGGGISTAGTANVEKEKAMNATFTFPELLTSLGTNPVSPQAPSDLHIQLSSNNDFEDALKQVMHIAELTQGGSSGTPMRVAIEIQTPPGAIVNVYVSKQDDGYRAQLSTNDPVALSWVQDKMSSLKSSDLGVEVRWLPPQMEGTSSISTSSTSDSNLSWDRGGQNQSGYQQPEDRRQSNQEKKEVLFPRLAGIGSENFMDNLTALGRAA
jgi:hypothetical protein